MISYAKFVKKNFVFMTGNTKLHTVQIVREYQAKIAFIIIEELACSPDINPIEY